MFEPRGSGYAIKCTLLIALAATCLFTGCLGGGGGGGGGGSEDDDAGMMDAGDVDPTQSDPNCESGLILCDGQCVDPMSNPRYCGRCESSCGERQICSGGICTSQPSDCPGYSCPGFAVCDESTGDCVAGCGDDSQCFGGRTCDTETNSCVCGEGQHACGGQCVASNTVETCGDRCQPCPTSPNGTASCVEGSCQLECQDGFKLCGGECVACPSGATETVCDGNQCVANACGSGARACGGECVDCPTENVGSTTCDGNACVIASCGFDFHQCGDSCVANDSVDHCGDRCEPCPNSPDGTASCDEGQCILECNDGARQCSSGCCSWEVETIATAESSVVISMDTDAQGTPWIAYYTVDERRLIVLREVGGDWEAISVINDADGDVELATGPNGEVFLAFFQNLGSGGTLTLAEWNGSSFDATSTELSNVTDDTTLSLEVDSSGAPHLTYEAYDSGSYDLVHAVRSGSGWTTEVVAYGVGSLGGRASLALDSSDGLHVAYYDSSGRDLYYATKSGGSWTSERVTYGGYRISLEINGQGQPAIAYTVISPVTLLFIEKGSGGFWSSSETVFDGPDSFELVYDDAGEPHIGGVNVGAQPGVSYARRTGTSWSTQDISVAGTPPEYASSATAVTPSGDAMIVYRAGTSLELVR